MADKEMLVSKNEKIEEDTKKTKTITHRGDGVRLEIAVLELLKKYSSKEHPLTLTEIIGYLEKDYSFITDEYNIAKTTNNRKRVRVALENIIKFDEMSNSQNIYFNETTDRNGDKKRVSYYTNKRLSDAELKFLVDSVMYSNIFSSSYSQDFAKRIKELSGKELDNATSYVNQAFGQPRFSAAMNKGIDVLDNVMKINKAMKEGTYIDFSFDTYDVGNEPKEIIRNSKKKYGPIRPVFTYLNNGRYVMVGKYKNSEKEYHYLIEHLSEIEVVKVDDKRSIKQSEKIQNRAAYIMNHPFDMGGNPIKYKLRVERAFFSRVYDTFATSLFVIPFTKTDSTVEVFVESSKEGLKRWLLLNYDIAELIVDDGNSQGLELKTELSEAVKILKEKY